VTRAAAEHPEDYESRMLFRAVSVFDVSQTDGEELPELPCEPISGDTHGEYLPLLEAFAAELGCTVAYEDLGESIGGYYRKSDSSIVVSTRASVNGQVRTLVHELAHALGVGYEEYGRPAAEVIVETAAVIVCGSIGLDTSGESIPYIATWGSRRRRPRSARTRPRSTSARSGSKRRWGCGHDRRRSRDLRSFVPAPLAAELDRAAAGAIHKGWTAFKFWPAPSEAGQLAAALAAVRS
jgi:antirestriction protein ArdC